MYLSERALYGTGDEVGRSGDAMIYHALRGSLPGVKDFPADTADLGRCVITYEDAPRKLRKRMKPILDMYTNALNRAA
jgi:hypothetical protein